MKGIVCGRKHLLSLSEVIKLLPSNDGLPRQVNVSVRPQARTVSLIGGNIVLMVPWWHCIKDTSLFISYIRQRAVVSLSAQIQDHFILPSYVSASIAKQIKTFR